MTSPGDVVAVVAPSLAAATLRARPKSSTLMCPSLVTITLAGLRSRWTMPRSCAAARAFAICAPYSIALRIGTGPRETMSASVSPSRSSVTAYARRPIVADVVDGDDVGVGEAGERLHLALEARERVGIGGEGRGKHLDGDVAPEARVARPIDLAHAARADGCDDLVRAQAGAGAKRHRATYPCASGLSRCHRPSF